MLTRRSLVAGGTTAAGAALLSSLSGFGPAHAQAASPIFRFGVVADPQYAPVPPRGTRFYSHSLWKLSEAVADFNTQDLEFVATLGDIIDRHWESYLDILPIYGDLNVPNFFVLGNHDYDVAGDYLDAVERITGLERAYYQFLGGGHRFLVLDGNEISLFANAEGTENHEVARARLSAMEASGAVNAKTWNGGISDAQFAWIEQQILQAAEAGERVIVMGHYPIYPKDMHNMWDDERLVDLFTAHDNVVLYMNGHNHDGNYGEASGTHFVNFKGMVETADTTAYATLEVWNDRIEMLGKGVEVSRTLAI